MCSSQSSEEVRDFAPDGLVVPRLCWWQQVLSANLLGASHSEWVALQAPSSKPAAQPCHSALAQYQQISEPSFLIFFFFPINCSFYFVAYFYLRQQSSSCGRRDTGMCYPEVGVQLWRQWSWCARRGYRPRGGRRSCRARGTPVGCDRPSCLGTEARHSLQRTKGRKGWWMFKHHFS